MKTISSALAVNGKELLRRGLLLAAVLMFMRHDASAAQAPVPLGTTVTFGVLGAATVTSTGGTIIYGDLGVSPGTAVTGSPGVTGRLHLSDPAAALAQSDLTKAYNDAAGRTTGSVTVAGNLGGKALAPGLYKSTSSLEISSGNLTLAGDANAVWIFQMGSTLTTTTGRQVILSGGAQSANIFWQVGSSATIGVSSVFKGTIMAAQSITMGTGATLEGRALAQAGQVTLDANTITVPRSVNPAGTVVAWGKSDYGQTNMPAGLSTLTAITAGESYTVALKSDGTVVAWGNDDYGQTDVPAGLSNVTAIAAGEYHTVALRSDGTVAAWGKDNYGQTLVPAFLSGVTAIAAGQWHTLVLKSDGTVVGWGADTYGQTDIPAGLSNVTAIAAGSGHSMALLRDGTVVAWGANGFFHQCTIPSGLSGVTAIAAGSSHSVALQSDGTVVAWGNDLFQQIDVPIGLTGVAAIAAGEYHTVALKSDGTVVAWGWNDDGETNVPPGLGGVTAIAAGWYHTAALLGPIITTQPLGQTFPVGGGVNLSVSAIGSDLSYQWQFNDTNISGATNSTLDLMHLSGANAGAYRVVVSSAAGGAVTGQETILSSLFFGNLKFYAGITLAGTVGQQFRVDYAEVVGPGTTNWQVLDTITLPFSPYLVIDPNSPAHAQRFYRAVPLL
jgi:hypothetical protein